MKEIKLIFLKSKITFEDKNTQKSFIEQFKKQGNVPFVDQDKKQIGLTYMDEEGFLVSVMEDKEYHRTHDIKNPFEDVSIGFKHEK